MMCTFYFHKIQEKVAIRSSFNLTNMFSTAMSANDLINFWDQTISVSGHFEFLNIYLNQEMQNDWTMNIKQNVMSHSRITH